MKRILLAGMLLSLLAILFTACGPASAGASSSSVAIVHMSEIQFVPTHITIKKGDKVTLADDVMIVHIIENGRWDSNGTQRPDIESGAPTIQAQFNGNDQQSIGPFNTAGTFHLYCTIHVDMNLLVVVQ